jgi:hypothetical protein
LLSGDIRKSFEELHALLRATSGAAGNGVPDQATQQAWLESTRQQAAGATEWFVGREGGVVSASIVREVRPRKPTRRPVYRVVLVCNPSTCAGEMHLEGLASNPHHREGAGVPDGNPNRQELTSVSVTPTSDRFARHGGRE